MIVTLVSLFVFLFYGALSVNENFVGFNKSFSDIPLKLLNQIGATYLNVHFDNTTVHELFELFGDKLINTKGSYIFNYDLNNSFHRVTANSYVNIVYLRRMMNFYVFSLKPYNLRTYDVVLMIFKGEELPERVNWSKIGLNKCAGFFFFNLDSVTLYSFCHYCNLYPTALHKIAQGIYDPNVVKLYDYKNFEGYKFQIAHPHYMPFFYCR